MYALYTYIFVVKKVASFQGLGQLMGVACNRMRSQALQTSKKKEWKLHVYLFYIKYIPKVLQDPLKVK